MYVFRKDRRDLAATLILYLLLNVPGAMMYWDADSNVRDVFDLPRSLTKNNCCAISLAVSIMFGLSQIRVGNSRAESNRQAVVE